MPWKGSAEFVRTCVSRVLQRDTLPFVTSKCRYQGVCDVAVLQSVAVCCNVLQCEDRRISRIATRHVALCDPRMQV